MKGIQPTPVAWALIIIFLAADAAFALPLCDRFPPVNASIAGTGFAGVALPDDPAIIYWNPAGLAVADLMSASFTVAAPRLESPGSWAFLVVNSSSVQNTRFGLAMVRHSVELDTLSYRTFQIITPLTYGFKSGAVPFGVSLKFISERFEDGSWHSGMSFDTGLLWTATSDLTLGYSTRNLTGSNLLGFSSESWFGGAWRGAQIPVTLSGQIRADRPFDPDWLSRHFNYGLRVSPPGSIYMLSGGYARSEDDSWLTAGVSSRNINNNTVIEYTFSVNTTGWDDQAHFLTYSYSMSPAMFPGGKGWR